MHPQTFEVREKSVQDYTRLSPTHRLIVSIKRLGSPPAVWYVNREARMVTYREQEFRQILDKYTDENGNKRSPYAPPHLGRFIRDAEKSVYEPAIDYIRFTGWELQWHSLIHLYSLTPESFERIKNLEVQAPLFGPYNIFFPTWRNHPDSDDEEGRLKTIIELFDNLEHVVVRLSTREYRIFRWMGYDLSRELNWQGCADIFWSSLHECAKEELNGLEGWDRPGFKVPRRLSIIPVNNHYRNSYPEYPPTYGRHEVDYDLDIQDYNSDDVDDGDSETGQWSEYNSVKSTDDTILRSNDSTAGWTTDEEEEEDDDDDDDDEDDEEEEEDEEEDDGNDA